MEFFPGDLVIKNPPASTGDRRRGFDPVLGRFPGEGNSNTFRYSCLEIPRADKPGGLQSMGSHRVGHDWVTNTFTFIVNGGGYACVGMRYMEISLFSSQFQHEPITALKK